MPRIHYGRSPWLENAPKARRPAYPRLATEIDVPVAIVGGGLAGAATAYALAAAGVRVALLEAGRVGGGATGRSAGQLLQELPVDYLDLEAAQGRRAARAAWQATRRAALECAAALRRLNVRCGLTVADGLTYACGADELKRLKRELAARRVAGIDAAWVTGRSLAALGIEAAGAIRTRGHARVDPWRACQGFVRAAAVRGAAVFEQSAVRRIVPGPAGVELETARGTVRCDAVVVATGEPAPLFPALERHFSARETYVVQTPPVPAAARASMPDRTLMLQDRRDPPHRLFWTSDEAIVWSGADQPRTPERAREKVLVQRTGQLMYELSLLIPAISGIQPERGWDSPYSITSDGLPFIGPHRNYPRHLFALGLGSNLAHAFLASRLLLRHCTGQLEKTDEVFGFARIAR